MEKVGKFTLREDRITEKKLFFENIYDDGEYFWFTEYDFNSLFRMNKISYIVEHIGVFPNEKFVQEKLYISTVECNKKMYFAPYSANEIAVYDLEKEKIEKIQLPISNKNYYLQWEKMKFFKAIALEDKVYFIPDHYPGILCYDTRTGDFKCFNDWIDKIEEKKRSNWGYFFSYTVIDEKIYLPCACADIIIIFDTITQKSKLLFTRDTDNECKYVGIFFVNHYFYLISANGVITKRKLNSENEEIKQINLPKLEGDGIEFYPLVYWNKWIYLFPLKNNEVYKINTDTDEIKIDKMFAEEKIIKKDNGLFLNCIVDSKKLYAMTVNGYCFIEYSFTDKSKRFLKYAFLENDCKLYNEYREHEFIEQIKTEYVMENSVNGLIFMLSLLQPEDKFNLMKNMFPKVKKGKEIYHLIK